MYIQVLYPKKIKGPTIQFHETFFVNSSFIMAVVKWTKCACIERYSFKNYNQLHSCPTLVWAAIMIFVMFQVEDCHQHLVSLLPYSYIPHQSTSPSWTLRRHTVHRTSRYLWASSRQWLSGGAGGYCPRQCLTGSSLPPPPLPLTDTVTRTMMTGASPCYRPPAGRGHITLSSPPFSARPNALYIRWKSYSHLLLFLDDNQQSLLFFCSSSIWRRTSNNLCWAI